MQWDPTRPPPAPSMHRLVESKPPEDVQRGSVLAPGPDQIDGWTGSGRRGALLGPLSRQDALYIIWEQLGRFSGTEAEAQTALCRAGGEVSAAEGPHRLRRDLPSVNSACSSQLTQSLILIFTLMHSCKTRESNVQIGIHSPLE